jgi:FKBP-type peptidyl-prolyl cis-trans isomerase 2
VHCRIGIAGFVRPATAQVCTTALNRRTLAPLSSQQVASFCSGGRKKPKSVAVGDNVKVHYTGTLKDGTVFDSSVGKDPIELTAGVNQIITGFDTALIGMRAGETKEVTLSPDDAYGYRDDAAEIQLPTSQLPAEAKVGSLIMLESKKGGAQSASVMEISDGVATVDLNHPLAGKVLTFTLEMVSVAAAGAEASATTATSASSPGAGAASPASASPSPGPSSTPDPVSTAAPFAAVQVHRTAPGDGATFPIAGAIVTARVTTSLRASGAVVGGAGQPFVCEIGSEQLLPGWEQAVLQMSLGERAVIHVPAAKAYGARAVGDVIPPDSDLIFDTELVDISAAVSTA